MHLLVLNLAAAPVVTHQDSPWVVVREVTHRKSHTFALGAPCDWSLARGATHTLRMHDARGVLATRPAIVANKSTVYVGVDETPEGLIRWEKWRVIMSASDLAAMQPA